MICETCGSENIKKHIDKIAGKELEWFECMDCGTDCNGSGIQSELKTEDEKIRDIDLFFEIFPLYSQAVSYQEDMDSFIGTSGSVHIQLIDIWNSRYQIFKAGMKSTQKEIEEYKYMNAYNRGVYEKQLSEKDKQIENLECCGNCTYEVLPSTREPCTNCIRNDFPEVETLLDNWKQKTW